MGLEQRVERLERAAGESDEALDQAIERELALMSPEEQSQFIREFLAEHERYAERYEHPEQN